MTVPTKEIVGTMMESNKTTRWHSAKFKAEVVAACEQPGASVAEVSRRYDLNAKLVQTRSSDRGHLPSGRVTENLRSWAALATIHLNQSYLSAVLGLAVALASAVKWLGLASVVFLILGRRVVRLRGPIGRQANGIQRC